MQDEKPGPCQSNASGGDCILSVRTRRVRDLNSSFIQCLTTNRKTLQLTEARIGSGFGWGLTRRIETHGLNKFKANLQRVCVHFIAFSVPFLPNFQSREGVSLVVQLLRQSRLHPMTLGGPEDVPLSARLPVQAQPNVAEPQMSATSNCDAHTATRPQNSWSRLKAWLRPPPRAD